MESSDGALHGVDDHAQGQAKLHDIPGRTVDVACRAVEAEHAGTAVEGRHEDLRVLRRRRLCGRARRHVVRLGNCI